MAACDTSGRRAAAKATPALWRRFGADRVLGRITPAWATTTDPAKVTVDHHRHAGSRRHQQYSDQSRIGPVRLRGCWSGDRSRVLPWSEAPGDDPLGVDAD